MANQVEFLTGLVNVAIPEVYQKGMSYYEVLTAVVNKVNELIKQSNEYFSEDVQSIMTNILIGWKDDGTLDSMIADAVLDIGSRTYTEQNYVTDNESVTASIDALDVGVAALDVGLAALDLGVAAHLAESVNVVYSPYNADPTGVADSTTAFADALAAAISSGKKMIIPKGTYKITAPLLITAGVMIVGDGIDNTIINSAIVGDSLFKLSGSSIAFVHMSGMTLQGNGISGALGSGHAINFIDPAIDSGTHNPQHCVIENLRIMDFLGVDKEGNGATTIESAGIIQRDGVENIYQNILIDNCGHGVYFRLAQNTKLSNCAITGCVKYGLFVYMNENIIIDKCDILNCGDGVASAGYPESGLLSGLVLSAKNEGFVIANSKLKSVIAGTACLVHFISNGDIVKGCWIRGDNASALPHKAIYAVRCAGLVIEDNTFSSAATAFAATQKYETIELYNTQTAIPFSATIQRNVFRTPPGQGIAYHIKITGSAQVRNFSGLSIKNNVFGDIDVKTAPTTIDAHILMDTCTIQNSEISNNVFYAQTNVTVTAAIFASVLTSINNEILRNTFITNGGTISANYSGITESGLNGTVVWDPGSLDDGAGETSAAITVTGAALGDFVLVSSPYDLQGITVNGYVSAANTVKIRAQNETGGTINLASGTWKVKVVKP